jgi:hypothetical protein
LTEVTGTVDSRLTLRAMREPVTMIAPLVSSSVPSALAAVSVWVVA